MIKEPIREVVILMEAPQFSRSLGKNFELFGFQTKLLPSILQAPELELKPLSKHLKYAFLGDGNILPIIVSSKLSRLEEENMNSNRRERKLEKRNSKTPHSINDEGREKEIQKLLDARMIYLIFDSKLVSPVHVVPKKIGMTAIKN
ncbi:reverse transcriptase [Gossypium australe]|uniref:Reverse transcriptase n=1 Tax=Gossypium australe TaxID=47621 RepID=A0A5B6VB90_9ROSI|nr:reverse transcriptase [Gossypium australe]